MTGIRIPNLLGVLRLFLLLATSSVLPPWPQTRQHGLLVPRLNAALFQPGVNASLDELCDFRHVLQTGA